MARLRETPASRQARRTLQVELPEDLATWFYDDWVDDGEQPTQPWRTAQPTATDQWFAHILLARTRIRAAREAWARAMRAQGLRPPATMPPLGAPRRRHPLPAREKADRP